MTIIKRIAVIFFPLLLLIGLELLFLKIELVYILFVVCLLILLLSLKLLIKEKVLSKIFFYLSVLPLLLYIFTYSFLLFVSSVNIRHLVIISFCLLMVIYLENLFLYYFYQKYYKPNSLENISALFNLLIFFLVIISLNAFYIFINLPIWMLSLVLIIVMILMIYQAYWINKIKSNYKLIYLIAIIILILEFFWSIAFLPANFYLNSIILTILYYCIWGLLKGKLSDRFEKKMVWRYSVISLILIAVVIFTSRWT